MAQQNYYYPNTYQQTYQQVPTGVSGQAYGQGYVPTSQIGYGQTMGTQMSVMTSGNPGPGTNGQMPYIPQQISSQIQPPNPTTMPPQMMPLSSQQMQYQRLQMGQSGQMTSGGTISVPDMASMQAMNSQMGPPPGQMMGPPGQMMGPPVGKLPPGVAPGKKPPKVNTVWESYGNLINEAMKRTFIPFMVDFLRRRGIYTSQEELIREMMTFEFTPLTEDGKLQCAHTLKTGVYCKKSVTHGSAYCTAHNKSHIAAAAQQQQVPCRRLDLEATPYEKIAYQANTGFMVYSDGEHTFILGKYENYNLRVELTENEKFEAANQGLKTIPADQAGILWKAALDDHLKKINPPDKSEFQQNPPIGSQGSVNTGLISQAPLEISGPIIPVPVDRSSETATQQVSTLPQL